MIDAFSDSRNLSSTIKNFKYLGQQWRIIYYLKILPTKMYFSWKFPSIVHIYKENFFDTNQMPYWI